MPWGVVGYCEYAICARKKALSLVPSMVFGSCPRYLFAEYVVGSRLWLLRKKQVLGEFPAASSDNFPAPSTHWGTVSCAVWLRGTLPQNAPSCPPCSCLSSDPSVWAKASSAVSSVFPEQVGSTCGTSKTEGTGWGAGLAGVRGVDAYLFWVGCFWLLVSYLNTVVNNTKFKGEIKKWAKQLITTGKGPKKKEMLWY